MIVRLAASKDLIKMGKLIDWCWNQIWSLAKSRQFSNFPGFKQQKMLILQLQNVYWVTSNCFKPNKSEKKYISLPLTNPHPPAIKTRRSATWMNELNMCGCAELMRSVLSRIDAMPAFSNHTPRRKNLTALGTVHTYPDNLNPQLFLSGYGFRPQVSGESGIRIRHNEPHRLSNWKNLG